ncbi:hypothetical protein ACWIGW_41290 [Nocardia brasiliensis]
MAFASMPESTPRLRTAVVDLRDTPIGNLLMFEYGAVRSVETSQFTSIDGTAMRLDRVTAAALLAVIVATPTVWTITAPGAHAGSDDVENCITKSDTYEQFKDCYTKLHNDAETQRTQYQAEQQAEQKRCEDSGGQWLQYPQPTCFHH